MSKQCAWIWETRNTHFGRDFVGNNAYDHGEHEESGEDDCLRHDSTPKALVRGRVSARDVEQVEVRVL
jgi:hypothetical protein